MNVWPGGAMRRAALRELDAAGIVDPALRSVYLRCRDLHAVHGRTYFLATRLLAGAQRPSVHALYGFARYADEIVDSVTDVRSSAEKRADLDALQSALWGALDRAETDNPLLVAVADTARRHGLGRDLFGAFLDSMRLDTTLTGYASYADLQRYMHGSAGVIGLQMLPVLGTVGPQEQAAPFAEELGVAFQLTNFLRDVGEDLDRGRVYLPADELAAFGVDRDLLRWCRRHGRADRRVRAALAHLVARTQAVYRRASPGIELLLPSSRPCVRTARTLYGAILDRIVDADYDVLNRRAVLPASARLRVAAPALARAYAARARRTRPDG